MKKRNLSIRAFDFHFFAFHFFALRKNKTLDRNRVMSK